jgi:hypothetical protein
VSEVDPSEWVDPVGGPPAEVVQVSLFGDHHAASGISDAQSVILVAAPAEHRPRCSVEGTDDVQSRAGDEQAGAVEERHGAVAAAGKVTVGGNGIDGELVFPPVVVERADHRRTGGGEGVEKAEEEAGAQPVSLLRSTTASNPAVHEWARA